MLTVPQEPGELISLLNGIARLNLGNQDFRDFIKWLESENVRLAKTNRKTEKEVLNRWQQGAGQLLDDLIEIVETAREKAVELEAEQKQQQKNTYTEA